MSGVVLLHTYIYAVVRARMSIDKQSKIKYSLFIQCSCVIVVQLFYTKLDMDTLRTSCTLDLLLHKGHRSYRLTAFPIHLIKYKLGSIFSKEYSQSRHTQYRIHDYKAVRSALSFFPNKLGTLNQGAHLWPVCVPLVEQP